MKKFDKKTQIKILKIILIVIWMAIVFSFSNQGGTKSGNTSRKVTVAVVQVISDKPIDGKNLNSAELREGEVTEDSGIKKKLKSFGETLKNGWDTAISGLQSFADKTVKKAKKLGGKLKKGFNTVKKDVHDFFMSHKEKY